LQAAVAERLDALTSWKVRIWAPLALGVMMMGDSWDIVVIGYVMPSLRAEWGLSALQVGALISSGFAGQLVGALSFGPLAERFGRMAVFNVAIVIMCVLSLACAVVQDPEVFGWLRFLQGVGFGGAAPVCASYINELAPTATRGRYFSIFQFLMVSGFTLCAVASAFIIPEYGWRAMFILGAFPVLLTPFVLMTLPESPRWLARLGRTEATNKALAKLGAAPVDANIDATAQKRVPRIPVTALFARDIRWHTLATCALWFLTSLVAYAFSTWTPTLYVDVFGLTLQQSLNYSAFIGIGYALTPLVFALILDRVGRRPNGIALTAVTLASTVALFALGQSNATASIVLIGVGWIMAGSAFVLLWPYTGEVFPTNIRSTALGLCSASARFGSMVTPLIVAGVLASTESIGAVFGVLAVPAAMMVLLWMFASKEMARRRLEEVGEPAS
jgi:putative MFS transporter